MRRTGGRPEQRSGSLAGSSSLDLEGASAPGRARSWTVLVCVSRDRQRIRNEPQWGQLRSWSPRGDPSFPISFTSSHQPPPSPQPPAPPPPHIQCTEPLWRCLGWKGGLEVEKGVLRLQEDCKPLLRLEK